MGKKTAVVIPNYNGIEYIRFVYCDRNVHLCSVVFYKLTVGFAVSRVHYKKLHLKRKLVMAF